MDLHKGVRTSGSCITKKTSANTSGGCSGCSGSGGVVVAMVVGSNGHFIAYASIRGEYEYMTNGIRTKQKTT